MYMDQLLCKTSTVVYMYVDVLYVLEITWNHTNYVGSLLALIPLVIIIIEHSHTTRVMI